MPRNDQTHSLLDIGLKPIDELRETIGDDVERAERGEPHGLFQTLYVVNEKE